MSSVLFVGDFHLGHKSILKLQQGVRPGYTIDQHDNWVVNQCLSVGPNKRTLWYILGDVSMEISSLERINELPGEKILVMGNHDKFETQTYLKYFKRIVGGIKKYGIWITHIPIHPQELLEKVNVHGHCHNNSLKNDPRYLNASIEWLPKQKPISLDQVRSLFRERGISI